MELENKDNDKSQNEGSKENKEEPLLHNNE
jgi:hypothetical protein